MPRLSRRGSVLQGLCLIQSQMPSISFYRCEFIHYRPTNLMNCNIVNQIWNGQFFERTTLAKLGLRVQLGHSQNSRCLNPRPATGNEFVVTHSNGVHVIALDFCACETAPSVVSQLLRSRLFPATARFPRSAATFHVLQEFQILSFESKVSAFEFYNALARLTNNIMSPPSVSIGFVGIAH